VQISADRGATDELANPKLLVGKCAMPYYCLRRGRKPRHPEGTAVITLCSQCDKPETECTCEKYCCFCQSQQKVRLCVDGLYYCPDCREACDVRLADENER
jgi:hypothetical protein